jgi:hypothetical protein
VAAKSRKELEKANKQTNQEQKRGRGEGGGGGLKAAASLARFLLSFFTKYLYLLVETRALFLLLKKVMICCCREACARCSQCLCEGVEVRSFHLAKST